jgi:hypothetical protein
LGFIIYLKITFLDEKKNKSRIVEGNMGSAVGFNQET